MKDLNTLTPSNSPLLRLAADGINDEGEITGQARVLADSGCPSGNEMPAFVAIPRHDREDFDANSTVAPAGAKDTPNAAMPEVIRQQLLQRLPFDHFGTNR